MSCYHPLVGLWKGEYTANGKKKYQIEGKVDIHDVPSVYEPILIPCGHCIGCRLDYSRSWADRMMLELETAKKAIFVTLTYSEETLCDLQGDHATYTYFDGVNAYASLCKRDCQLFMKNLRRSFDGQNGKSFRKIRFFLAGEYGPRTQRPHYHAIIFGLGLDDFPDLESHGRNELGQNYYISMALSDIWSHGFVLLSDVSWKTCAYVARYVTKKLSGPMSIEYAERNVIPEFSLMSRKPGIGRDYLELHPDCLDMKNINLSTPEGGLKIQIPKYYYKQLISDSEKNTLRDPERYDKIMKERKEYAEDRMILELQKTGLGFLDYLEMKEQKKLESAKLLKRGDV